MIIPRKRVVFKLESNQNVLSELEVNPQAEKIPSSVKSVAISEHSSL